MFACFMLLLVAKPKVISEALGHSSVAFTMDVYSHIISGIQEDAMAFLDQMLPAGINAKFYKYSFISQRGSVVEQRFRKPPVVSSTLTAGSSFNVSISFLRYIRICPSENPSTQYINRLKIHQEVQSGFGF